MEAGYYLRSERKGGYKGYHVANNIALCSDDPGLLPSDAYSLNRILLDGADNKSEKTL